MAELLIIALLFAALVGLVFCWAEWQKQLDILECLLGQKTGLTFGLFAATSQALLMYEPWTTFQRVVFGCAYLGVMFSMYLASRRMEKRQLEKDIARCRLASRFVSTIAG